MFGIRRIAIVAVALLATTSVSTAGTYGSYRYSASRGYHYRTYSYYSVTARAYHRHVAVYRPTQPRYVYYYNGQTRVYWGRYDLETGKYQLLPDGQKKANLCDIPQSAFLPGGPMPNEGAGSDEALLPPPEAPVAPAAGCRR